MTNRAESTRTKDLATENEDQKCIRLRNGVSQIEIELAPPRLIRIVGKTSKGGLIERHLKITDSEKMVMV